MATAPSPTTAPGLAELEVSDAVRAAIVKEIDRFERVGEQSMESSWIRTWLDTIFELPWNARTDDNYDLARRPHACSTRTTPASTR